MRLSRATLAMAAVLMSASAAAQQPQQGQQGQLPAEMKAVMSDSLQWSGLTLPGFDPGLELAVVVGDPAVADQPYTLRLRFPDGYRFPAHYHPRAENVTVVTGTFMLGMGANESAPTTTYQPGDYLYIPAEKPHFGSVRGQTVVQLHGMGPFEVKLANP